MSLIYIVSNLLLITNLLALPIHQNYYYQNNIEIQKNIFQIKSEKNKTKKIFPIKKNNNSLGINISAESVLVQDLKSNKTLWSKDSKKIRPIASISKLMTAIVLSEIKNLNWNKEVKIEKSDIRGDFNKLKIFNWETIKFQDLFNASLVTSCNTGIEISIKNSGITRKEFIQRMNKKAQILGLKNTKFEDPTGLSKNNISTAEEVLKFAKKAFSFPKIKKISSQKIYSFSPLNSSRKIYIKNTNELIGGYLKIEAGKTGYTDYAQFCLVSELSYQNKGPILISVLGSKTHYERFSDLKAIATWTFNNYLWK